MNAALDDDHKHQAAAWKLMMDRMLPVSYFEKDKLNGGRSSISINITGVGSQETTITDRNSELVTDNPEVMEGEYTEYE
jgi:multimeric flavodoxin WrbA